MPSKDEWLKTLRSSIPEVSPEDVRSLLEEGGGNGSVQVLDVRDSEEFRAGHLPGALHISGWFLPLQAEAKLPDRRQRIVTYCAGGVRSLFAAEALRKLGYENVSSMKGGFARWKQNGHPFDVPEMLTDSERERYARHITIDEVGEHGQLKLKKAKVLCVGAGGLGSPAAYYLAAAGVGTLGVLDFDVVDRSNLQRQILHSDGRVGTSKVESARDTLLGLNPDIRVVTHEERLTSENVDRVFSAYDIILDGCDNFPTRYLVNDACVKHRKPNVHGSIYRFEGQCTVFWPGRGPCYRCLFPEPPPPEMAPSCAEAGVLGVLPGVIGVLEAIEVVKIVLGKGDLLVGRLLTYDALEARFRELKIQRDPDCKYCADGRAFPGYVDYAFFCGV
jgi:molybdopterin/thiamine biosynthesis adenylyltransferase